MDNLHMTDAVLGVRLIYWFPLGPTITVLLTELFTEEMQNVIRLHKMRYGTPRVFQPFNSPTERRQRA
jgi:hypothetical protein